jgi:CBS domain-containing protein
VSPDLEDLEGGGLEGGLRDPEELEAASTPQLLGWIDTSDILRAFFAHLDAHLAAERRALPTRMLELMTLLEKVGPAFASRPLITVTDCGDRALIYQAGPTHSLLGVVRDQFLGGGRAVHRVAVFDGRGAITAIVSQLDVMRFLLRAASAPGKDGGAGGGLPARLAGASLVDLGLVGPGRPAVMTVAPDTPTLLALRDMLSAGVSGAAVCYTGASGGRGAPGEMIANLSVSDVRAIQPTHLSALALPVCELLAVIHRTTYAGYSAGASKHSSHPFFQHRAGGGAGVASRGLRPPPGGSPTASVGTASTAATGATQQAAAEASTAEQAPAAASAGGGPPPAPTDDGGDVRLITCPPETTLAGLLELFLAHGVHRVYVATDPDRPVPVGVVSPTDVMRLVVGG